MSQTLQEQAKELVNEFRDKLLNTNTNYNLSKGEHPIDIAYINKAAKQCALICNQREIDVVERLLANRTFGNKWEQSRKEFKELTQWIIKTKQPNP